MCESYALGIRIPAGAASFTQRRVEKSNGERIPINMKLSNLLRLLSLLFALTLVASACGSDSDDGENATDDDSSESDDSSGDGDDDGEDTDSVDLAQGGSTLAAVQERGSVVCGGNDTLPGFGIVDDSGTYSGFDVDFCKVVAAAVLGDANAFELVPLTAEARFTALQSGEVDVLIRNTTWTATRDGGEGANFLFTTFYDGQGMMVPASTGFSSLEDMADANICVLSGTTTELNLNAVFSARGIPFNPVVFEDNTQLRPAYEEGQCEGWDLRRFAARSIQGFHRGRRWRRPGNHGRSLLQGASWPGCRRWRYPVGSGCELGSYVHRSGLGIRS